MKTLTRRPAGCASPPTSRMSWTSRRQRRQADVAVMRLGACRAWLLRRPGRGALAAGDLRRDGLERLIGARTVGAAGLGEIGAAAAPFAAERLGADAGELDRVVSASQVSGDADHEPGFALIADADYGDDAGAQLLLCVVDQSAQILRRDAVHGRGRAA